jgi:YHS domain-containing protein
MRMAAAGMQAATTNTPQAVQQRAMDPVCGVEVDPVTAKTAGLSSDYRGQTHYFSTIDCKTTFQKNPEGYSKAAVNTQGAKAGNRRTTPVKAPPSGDASMQGHSMESQGTTSQTTMDRKSGSSKQAN